MPISNDWLLLTYLFLNTAKTRLSFLNAKLATTLNLLKKRSRGPKRPAKRRALNFAVFPIVAKRTTITPIGFYIRSRFLNWLKTKSRKIISKFNAGLSASNPRKKNYKHGI
ncbi:hypothetical protein GGTG_02582 [Gaeumannomyces tritici R3-111a-1]|uniref:Uncharacterized protein n=1 Tax=Gaeumannomyces tritici (strain R3-111a-1) TaxID=644352 RepID=J3NMS6_GAET3|nr:hypothetical protein GGTG_02582 [Gaeumannomyces tritici R3-111a-1]EJT82609.1 hypothetical protein GGTG_02582 [Gaeumannomyces tritici R3-111a-1]